MEDEFDGGMELPDDDLVGEPTAPTPAAASRWTWTRTRAQRPARDKKQPNPAQREVVGRRREEGSGQEIRRRQKGRREEIGAKEGCWRKEIGRRAKRRTQGRREIGAQELSAQEELGGRQEKEGRPSPLESSRPSSPGLHGGACYGAAAVQTRWSAARAMPQARAWGLPPPGSCLRLTLRHPR